jgi:hypothetical protein
VCALEWRLVRVAPPRHRRLLALISFVDHGAVVAEQTGPHRRRRCDANASFTATRVIHARKLASITLGITNTPRNFHPGALAYAEPYAGQSEGVHIRVFFDRVENVAGSSSMVPILLAHVLVHEITHILQDSDHHSEEGVTKKRYTAADLYHMSFRPLPFSQLDIDLIRRGMSNQGRTATSSRLGNRDVAELAAAQ